MTKLLEWLSGTFLILSIWLSVVWQLPNYPSLQDYNTFILLSPITGLLLFGIYAATVVLYRVFTFNDCEEAAIELKKQIQEAKMDLTSKGFQF